MFVYGGRWADTLLTICSSTLKWMLLVSACRLSVLIAWLVDAISFRPWQELGRHSTNNLFFKIEVDVVSLGLLAFGLDCLAGRGN